MTQDSADRTGGRHSVAFYERVLSAVQDAVIAIDRDGLVTLWNTGAHELYGYTEEEALGTSLNALIMPIGGRRVAQAKRGELLRDGAYRGAWPVCDKRGREFTVHVSVAAITNDAGELDGAIGISRDVTKQVETFRALERNERRFRARFEQSGMPQAILGLDGRFLDVNDALCSLVGRRRKEMVGQRTSELHHPSDAAFGEQRGKDLFDGGVESATWQRVFATGDGSPVPVLVYASLIRDAAGQPDTVACFFQDLTQLRAAETEISRVATRFRAIVETAQDGIWSTDAEGNTLFANQKLADILGHSLEAIYRLPAPVIVAPHDPETLAEKVRTRASRGPEVYEMDYQHPCNGVRRLRVSVAPFHGDHGDVSMAVVSDITHVRQVEDELRRRALYDELTGLPNRTLLRDRLDGAVARVGRGGASTVAVLFLDLDHFKLINDTWGHEYGDRLLQQVAVRLQAAVRDEDTVVRFGGDEFVVVCEVADVDEAQRAAARIAAALDDPFTIDDQQIFCGVSVGIALSPPAAAAEVLRFADAAMNSAKDRGRGRVATFDAAIAHEAEARLTLGRDLRVALAEQQLQMHYQPIVDLATGAVVSVEGLARWTHAARGEVSPELFVGVATQAGLSAVLDSWALRRGADDLLRMRSRLGRAIPIAINVSAANLTDSTLEQELVASLSEFEVPHGGLIVEITENALMEHPQRARETIERLKRRGVATAIDDFGTGYSSLAYLNQLPVQTLKIDRSFTSAMAEDEDAFAIVAAIIDLARTLGLRTVAEGIETTKQLALLKKLGCWGGQGYLWSPALPLDELCATVARGDFGVATDNDPAAAPVRRRRDPVAEGHGLRHLLRLHREGASLTTIAAALNAEGYRTPQGNRWHKASVARVISDLAYPRVTA